VQGAIVQFTPSIEKSRIVYIHDDDRYYHTMYTGNQLSALEFRMEPWIIPQRVEMSICFGNFVRIL